MGILVSRLHLSCMHACVLQDWRKLDSQKRGPCPVGRNCHAAVCLGYGGDHPQLLVTGGKDNDLNVLSDAWILDLQSGKWREVRVLKGSVVWGCTPGCKFWTHNNNNDVRSKIHGSSWQGVITVPQSSLRVQD